MEFMIDIISMLLYMYVSSSFCVIDDGITNQHVNWNAHQPLSIQDVNHTKNHMSYHYFLHNHNASHDMHFTAC